VRSLRPLKSRNFALLWSAALVSSVGSWMQAVALGIYVTARTHDPLWTGLVAAAAFIPVGLLSPVGGAMADRLDRRRWLMLTTAAEMLMAAVLTALVATGKASPTIAVLMAFLGGAAGAIGFPSYQAMLPDLVASRDDILSAVALSSAQYNLGRVIGPVLAGVVLALGSYQLAFACNAASFAAVLIALVFVRLPRRAHSAERSRVWDSIVDGARVAFHEPGCRAAIILIGVVALLGSPFIALVPAMAIVGLHLGSGHRGSIGTAVLVTAQGVGAVLGAVLLPLLANRVGRKAQLTAALFVLPVLLVGYAVAPSLWWAAVALLLVGACYIGVLSGLNSVVQLRAPTGARGRVLSFYMLSLGVLYPVGAIVQGAIGTHSGVREVTAAGGLALLVVMVTTRVLRPGMFGSLGDRPGMARTTLVTPSPTAGQGPEGDSELPEGDPHRAPQPTPRAAPT
jgi:MFS family permease